MAVESLRLFGAELMSPEDVATALSISPATIRRWLRDGAIAGVKVGRQWRVNVTLVREKIASGELARELAPQGYKTLKAVADVLTVADEADRQEAIRYLLNALRLRLSDDQDMAAFLRTWQQEISERLDSLNGRDAREYSQSRSDFVAEHGSDDIRGWCDDHVDPVTRGNPKRDGGNEIQ
jgi:excisionase family DNA binding protein